MASTSDQNYEQEVLYSKQYRKNKKMSIECYKCHRKGHKAKECRSKVYNKRNMNLYCAEETCLNTNNNKEKLDSWCLDSGCTSHMTHEIQRFRNIEKGDNKSIKLASENCTAQIEGRGTAKLNIKEQPDLQLTEALYIPTLTTNLISVGKLTDKGATVLFQRNSATVMRNGTILLKAFRNEDGLYYVKENNKENVNYCKTTNMLEWHRKLAHLNEGQMKIALNKRNINGLEFDKNDTIRDCEVCVKGKATKLPFKISKNEERTNERLQIVHTDVCGPMRQPSKKGSKYFITFTDDYSRYTRIYIMKTKDEALSKFREYKNEVERFTKQKIIYLQSDNGTEYINHEFDKYLKDNGIKRRLSAPYTPEQNGLAERKNRTLLDKATCMLIDANMTEDFWAEAVNTANYLANRSPCSSIDNATPFEKWVNRIPSVRHLHIFGSKAFVLNKGKRNGKFESRATVGIFVGYSENHKAYRIFNPNSEKILISRDVKVLNKMFNENKNKDEQKQLIPKEEDLKDLNRHEFYESEQETKVDEPVETGNEVSTDHEIETTTSSDEKRQRKPPAWHQDYEMDVEQIFFCEINKNSDEWEEAIISEIESHLKNNTWKVVHINESKNVIDSKMILKYKYNELGEIDRRKARLVARGFNQKEGIDYTETFAPVAKLSTVRLLIAHAMENDMKLCQLDVCTAFLNGDIDEQIYMKKPKNLDKYLNIIILNGKDKELVRKAKEMLEDINKYKNEGICKLNKAIYGLKQAGRQWFLKLHKKLLEIGFRNATADPCLYILEKEKEKLFANIYVDDLILGYKSDKLLKEVKLQLQQAFDLRDMGSLHHCLGIRFTHVGGEMILSQENYIENLIEKFNMGECKPVSTPMEIGLKLEKNENEEEKNDYPYQKLIGSLMYLAIATRPDIMFAVSYLSQYNNCYGKNHWQAAKRIIRYLKGTKSVCIRYKKSGMPLIGMTDADWAACTVDRRSYTGYIFKYGGGLISYETKKQRVVALSTAEAEYMAMTEAAKEALHLKHLLEDIGVFQESVTIYNDNLAAQKLANNLITGKRSKHISIREHFIRDCIQKKLVAIKYKDTENMEADLLTKALPQPRLLKLLKKIGVTQTCA